MTKKFGGALQQLQQAKAAALEPRDPERPETGNPGTPEVRNPGSPEAGKRGSPEPEKAGSPEAGPVMDKYTTTLERSLIRRLKMFALQNDLKHQEVVAEALELYLASRGERGRGE